jgi:conjugative transfer signal peptidase TraF
MIILSIFIVFLAFILIPKKKYLFINTTSSLPVGIYYLSNDIISLQKTVVFKKPSFLSKLQRNWLIKDGVFIKKITAGPGDKVCAMNGTLFINDKEMGIIKTKDHNGENLPNNTNNMFCRTLIKGEFWTGTNHPNSFDSRYYGPINESDLKIVKPLILFQ